MKRAAHIAPHEHAEPARRGSIFSNTGEAVAGADRGSDAATMVPKATRPKPKPEPKVAPADLPSPLLADILAAPDDDAPRLVFADQLLDRGDLRGEFIHLQLVLRRALKGASGYPHEDPAHAVPPDHLALQARELALFKRHAKTWIAPVRSAIRGWYWKRGFLDDIIAGPSFFAGSAELLQTHPVTKIRFEGLTPKAFDQLATAKLGTIRKLTVYGRQVTSRTARALTNPNLADLRHLTIAYSEIGAEGLAALATSHLRSLRSLSISGTFGDAGLAALATSTSFDSLEALNFVDPDITDRGLVAFAGAAHFPRLAKVTIEVPTYSSTSPASLNWSRAGIRALAERFGDAGTETYYGKRIEM